MTQPLKVFISYAKKDEKFKNKLLEHLSSLTREKIITPWEDSQIEIREE